MAITRGDPSAQLRSTVRPRIIAALTIDATRSYDAIATEFKVSSSYVRSLASRTSRASGNQLRRKKLSREHQGPYTRNLG
jgi:hypothetical protein